MEVCGNGTYYQWRKGRGKQRISKYGGAFEKLTDERKAEYQTNRKVYAERRAPDTPAKFHNVPRGGSEVISREHGTGNADNTGGSGYAGGLVSAT